MKVELQDALEFPYSDSIVAARPCCSMTIDVARGGTGSVHILFNGLTEGEPVRLSVLRNKGPVRATWFRLIDVPVEANTGPVERIEKKGECNPFVSRRAPFRVCDVVAPVSHVVDVSSSIMALRLHIPVGRNEKTGLRKYTLRIRHGKQVKNLYFTLNVHKAVIPPIGRKSFSYTNWFNLNNMAQRHGLKPWSEDHWQMIRNYADLMAHARQNMFLIPLADVFTMKSKVPVLDRKRLRRLVKVFTDAGLYFIEGGHVAGRNEWKAPTFNIGLTGTRATSAEGNADLACIAGQLMEEVEKNKWQKRWIQHVTDEPIKENATDYRILAGMVRRHMPGLPVLDATMEPEIVGSVDIWCPQAQDYQEHRKHFEDQQAVGDKVWFYTCLAPGGPWLNRLLDMELLRPALLGWGAALFGLDGFLHWGLNHYVPDQDPFHKSVTPMAPGGDSFLPAGDTHVVYPGTDGPWSSLRLEAQREGFEDYELLRILRMQDEKTACKVIRKAIRGFDKYTKNVRTFRTARKALLHALCDD